MWDLNWVAVLLAAAAGFGVGGVWYGPLFGKAWQARVGLDDAALKDGANMPMIYGMAFLLNLASSVVLAHVLDTYGDPAIGLSVMIAGGIALGFVVPAIGVNYLFSRKSLGLFMIDGGYWLVIYCVMGALFGAFA